MNNTDQIASLKHQVKFLQQQLKELSEVCEFKVDRGAQALQLAEMIIENSPAILFRRLAAKDLDSRKMVYVSPNISRFGYQVEDFLENHIMYRQIVHPEDHHAMTKDIDEHVDKGDNDYFQTYRVVTKSGELRWVEDRTSIVRDELTGQCYHQGIILDVHEKKEAEEKLRRSEEKYRRIVDTAGEGFLLMDENLCIVDLNNAFARMVGQEKTDLYGTNPFSQGTGDYIQYLNDCQNKGTKVGYREFECRVLHHNEQFVPVLVHANTLRTDSGAVIGNMAFVTDLTQQKKALQLAGKVQRDLLPHEAPKISGLEIACRSIPCDEVGGDYFDFLIEGAHPQESLSIIVGDITGHGVDAALLMSSARAFLRMGAANTGIPTEIVTTLNQHLTRDFRESGRFMTMFYLTLDRQSGAIEWIRAGHDPALLYDPERDMFKELKGPGLALGVKENYAFESRHMSGLKVGQIIIIGTDGIWESCNPSGEMFGKERLMEIIRNTAVQSAEVILESIFLEHLAFSSGLKNEDDLTLVIVKIQPC